MNQLGAGCLSILEGQGLHHSEIFWDPRIMTTSGWQPAVFIFSGARGFLLGWHLWPQHLCLGLVFPGSSFLSLEAPKKHIIVNMLDIWKPTTVVNLWFSLQPPLRKFMFITFHKRPQTAATHNLIPRWQSQVPLRFGFHSAYRGFLKWKGFCRFCILSHSFWGPNLGTPFFWGGVAADRSQGTRARRTSSWSKSCGSQAWCASATGISVPETKPSWFQRIIGGWR